MTVHLDLESIERLILRNSAPAIEGLGFDLADGAPPIEFSFGYDQDNNCTGIEISQSFDSADPQAS